MPFFNFPSLCVLLFTLIRSTFLGPVFGAFVALTDTLFVCFLLATSVALFNCVLFSFFPYLLSMCFLPTVLHIALSLLFPSIIELFGLSWKRKANHTNSLIFSAQHLSSAQLPPSQTFCSSFFICLQLFISMRLILFSFLLSSVS